MFANTYAYFADKVQEVVLPDMSFLKNTPHNLPPDEIATLQSWSNEGFLHTFLVLFDVNMGSLFRKLAGIQNPFITISSRMGLSIYARQQTAKASNTKPFYPVGLMLVVLFLQFCESNHCSKALLADAARGILGARESMGIK